MVQVLETDEFADWLSELRDDRARARIAARIDRLTHGNPGDCKPAGEGISEMRIDYAPGYRVYFLQRGEVVVILLCGGDKSTQAADITRAKELAKSME